MPAGLPKRLRGKIARLRRRPLQKKELEDPGAGQDHVVGVEDGGLAWGDGALRGIESDAGARVGKRLDGGWSGFVLVANLYRGADWLRWLRDRNPIDGFDFERRGAQSVVVADDDAIVLRFDSEHVERLAGSEAQTLALADGEIVNAIVAAENFAGFGDDIAVACAKRNFVFRSVGVDELDVVTIWNEA